MNPGAGISGGAMPYAGVTLDRATARRQDPAWVSSLAAHPHARLRPLWRDECLTDGTAPVLMAPPAPGDGTTVVLLGLDGDTPEFAVDLSHLDLAQALAVAGAAAAADVRSLFSVVSGYESGVLAYARGLLRWHRHQRHCGVCGTRTESASGGHLRRCTNPECATMHFPRIEPAVITLVELEGPPSRCLLARHRASRRGGYSLVAGFAEIGESLEDTVRREVREEVGVEISAVTYAGSQPWPFPSGLMVAFRSTATGDSISVDGEEIGEARWFTGRELRQLFATSGWLGRPDSIAHALLSDWLEENGPGAD